MYIWFGRLSLIREAVFAFYAKINYIQNQQLALVSVIILIILFFV